MELLRGEDLQQVLAKSGASREDVALRVATQACRDSARARSGRRASRHQTREHLSRASATENDVVVKILDFGIARVKEQMAASENRALTTTGVLLGSPLYMSPEQVLRPKDIDQRTDLLVARRRLVRNAHRKNSVRRRARNGRRALRFDLRKARAVGARIGSVDQRRRGSHREEGARDRRCVALRVG